MNYFHLEAKVVSRGAGRSAIAAAAYASCSRLYNDYDGLTHDYTRKHGCLYSEVFLPQYAPEEWKDRQLLWEAVESVEKTKDSRLARELVVALPSELSLDDWKGMLERFVREQGIDLGMCADVNIHDPYPPGHNPHSHILFTVRSLDEHGKAKTFYFVYPEPAIFVPDTEKCPYQWLFLLRYLLIVYRKILDFQGKKT